MSMRIPADLMTLLTAISQRGGKPYVVGGAVRDWLMGREPKDLDIEVHGLESAPLCEIVGTHGSVDLVGKCFGVFKVGLQSGSVDVSLPRRESKSGAGHRAFDVSPDSSMDFEEAAFRRDFTINAMGWDPIADQLIDPWGGQADLKSRTLRAVSTSFADDPLRALRAFRFVAQFGFSVAPATVRMCAGLVGEYKYLPPERIWGEWSGWATKGTHLAMGLRFLEECGWLSEYPELDILICCPQDSEWHPEGDVFAHTGYTVDAAAEISRRESLTESDRLALVLAALCHDMGKATTTVRSADGRWVSPGHAQAGAEPATSFLKRIGAHQSVIDRVLPLVAEHMCHIDFARGAGAPAGRRLARRIYPATIRELCLLCEADHAGRPPLPREIPRGAARLAEMAGVLNVLHAPAKSILMGRHLIDLGMKPGPAIGKLLAEALEAQLDGVISTLDEALTWAKERL